MTQRFVQILRDRRNRKFLYSTAAYWNGKAENFDDTAISMWPNQSLNRLYQAEQETVILRHLPALQGKALIDVGCGTGRLARWFAERGARVLGIDFSAGSLRIAERESVPGNPAYRQCSVFDLEHQATFDIAFTWGVLAIACKDRMELREVLMRLRCALRDGGTLLLLEPIHGGFLHRVLKLPVAAFLDEVRGAGFEVNAVEPMHFWPMRLFLAYASWPSVVTVPLYHLGQRAMKMPVLSRLADYWAIRAHAVSGRY